MRGPMILRSRSRRAGDSATRCAVFWPFAHSRGKGFIYANRWHKTPLPLAGGKYHAGVTNCHGVECFALCPYAVEGSLVPREFGQGGGGRS